MEVRPGSIEKPFYGITGANVDAARNEPYPAPGKIVLVALKFDWPSRMRTYWRNEEAFQILKMNEMDKENRKWKV